MPDYADKPLRILIVDDDPDWNKFIRAFVEASGHTWETANNLEEAEVAIEEAEEEGYSFSAVTIDEKVMESLTGKEFLRYVRSNYPDIPCILITGSLEKGALQLKLKDDFELDAYISKSKLDSGTFAEAVARAIKRARLRENQVAKVVDSNNMILHQALFLFRNAMLSFIVERLRAAYGKEWWSTGVQRVLGEQTISALKRQFDRRYEKDLALGRPPGGELYQMLDMVHFPQIIQGNWARCFVGTFEGEDRNIVEVRLREIIEVRNAVAHSSSVSHQDLWRALDTIAVLVRPIDVEVADQIIQIRRNLRAPEAKAVEPSWFKKGPYDYRQGFAQLEAIILQEEGQGSEIHIKLERHRDQLTRFLWEKRFVPGGEDSQLENRIEHVLEQLDRLAIHYSGIPFADLCVTTAASTRSPMPPNAPDVREAYAVVKIEDHQTASPFVLHREYKLLAGILSSIPTEFVGVPVQLPSADAVEMVVVVRAAGMDILPHWAQRLIYFRGRDSGLLEFQVIPREAGLKQILVEFYYQQHWLAQIKFEVDVVEAQELVPA